MLSAGVWEQSQANTILFVMVDSSGTEITGLGSGFTLELSKGGAAFAASAGTKAEVGNGWYRYTSTAVEADTRGPLAIRVTGAGAVQQNLEYVVAGRTITAVAFTYTLTDDVSGDPIAGAQVWISANAAGSSVVWYGVTDNFGVARDGAGNLPRLDPGTYYIFRQHQSYTFSDPDTEVVA